MPSAALPAMMNGACSASGFWFRCPSFMCHPPPPDVAPCFPNLDPKKGGVRLYNAVTGASDQHPSQVGLRAMFLKLQSPDQHSRNSEPPSPLPKLVTAEYSRNPLQVAHCLPMTGALLCTLGPGGTTRCMPSLPSQVVHCFATRHRPLPTAYCPPP
ncbi:hypothetical protein LY78DRAFT_159556 [Colletotrichum sublineola]|nr:hypothetical protein LY78DRAFT_159556 [Colletotrichum sublineola]